MNDQNFEKLSALKDEHLSKDERELLRGKIVSFMQAHPVTAKPSPYVTSFRKMRKPLAISSVLALFALSAGVSYASETALPGDLLYPVKIRVNEVVRAQVARSPSAKAKVAQKQIERRVGESEELAKRNRVDEVTKKTLQKEALKAMETFVDAQKALVKEGKKMEAEKRTEEVEQTFKAHRTALSALEVTVFRSGDKGEKSGKTFMKEEIRGQKVSTTSAEMKERSGGRRFESVPKNISSGTSTKEMSETPRASDFTGDREGGTRRDRERHLEKDREDENEDFED